MDAGGDGEEGGVRNFLCLDEAEGWGGGVIQEAHVLERRTPR